jgi:hypothetical protein
MVLCCCCAAVDAAAAAVHLQTGSGRRVGENCEHLWALLRAVLKLARYMGKRRYLAALETALQLISDDKLQAIIQTMVDMDAACRKKLGEQPLCCGLQLRAFLMSGGRGAQMLWRWDHCT